MKFIFGMIDSEGLRHVVTGDALPQLVNMESLGEGLSCEVCDWGPTATEGACRYTATIVLQSVGDLSLAKKYCAPFADNVVKAIDGGSWFLDTKTVRGWLDGMIDRDLVSRVC